MKIMFQLSKISKTSVNFPIFVNKFGVISCVPIPVHLLRLLPM